MSTAAVTRGCSARAAGVGARVAAVLGAQWGDEGKGKLADVLAQGYDIVGRFNGGNNAGHTVVVGDKKYAFHLLPCGLIYPHTTNILGNGTVIHVPSLFEELAPLDADGLEWKGRLLLSDRAHLLFDFHREIDAAQESHRGDSNIGTTKKGIGPSYASKIMRSGVRVGALRDFEQFEAQYHNLLNEVKASYDIFDDYDEKGELERYRQFSGDIAPHDC